MASLSDEEAERYARQLVLRDWGGRAQARLRQSHVVIVGLGALGGPVARMLAAGGAGQLTLIDDDMVALSNLHRQPLFTTGDVGQAKALITAGHLKSANPLVSVTAHVSRLETDNAADLCAGADLLIDASDNFVTRYALNAASRALGAPLLSGAVGGWQGQVGLFNTGPDAPCYGCWIGEEPPEASDCQISGVLAPLCGVVASVIAQEAMRFLGGVGAMQQAVWLFDGQRLGARQVRLHRDPACPICGDTL